MVVWDGGADEKYLWVNTAISKAILMILWFKRNNLNNEIDWDAI